MDISAILFSKYPDAQWNLNGDDYEGLDWVSDSKKPTKAELEKLWPVVQAELEAQKQAKINARAALLERLGITEEEARTLLS